MAEPNQSFPFGFDWKKFEELFQGLKTANRPGSSLSGLDWIDKFVKEIVAQTVPEAEVARNTRSETPPLHTEIFETHRNVIARVHVPPQVHPRKLQLLVSSDQLRIEGPEGRKQTLDLPAFVNTRVCKAIYRNDVIQIQMRKKSRSGRFEEVFVQFP